ncbi:hypothetical protein TPHA_0F03310 [Tetrapisispora phaffii CBS 4417]|uniref:Uncharacterized protein n=1 Tax=Tetrapisispora phaffii (strain ATCC 24235 / CBS 4417 / NBRC 1672 / NRRL Y-8282 / UCD 70-5) TaxID=1071381 RepID=G8BUM6_TETPH|nr:hypothetical protein TPHA_0F03310 [Tetrapisispora phaffii CBS 4417]CCE63812.1 hypothetical protein TPHA_0F03310 [Tetrapisispora phaffii CBS 4417]
MPHITVLGRRCSRQRYRAIKSSSGRSAWCVRACAWPLARDQSVTALPDGFAVVSPETANTKTQNHTKWSFIVLPSARTRAHAHARTHSAISRAVSRSCPQPTPSPSRASSWTLLFLKNLCSLAFFGVTSQRSAICSLLAAAACQCLNYVVLPWTYPMSRRVRDRDSLLSVKLIAVFCYDVVVQTNSTAIEKKKC